MARSDRLFALNRILRDGEVHRARDMARALGVSVRTIYRDMDTLAVSGIPVAGDRGTGYRLTSPYSLPPLNLDSAEFEALNLGVAIVAEAADPELRSAAESLAAKLDAALPERIVADAETWKFAVHPFADAARGAAHLPTLRAAIRARQKLHLTYRAPDSSRLACTVRPLLLEHWARVWILTAWCELRRDFRLFRLDLIESAEALPEIFRDEPGKGLDDCKAAQPA